MLFRLLAPLAWLLLFVEVFGRSGSSQGTPVVFNRDALAVPAAAKVTVSLESYPGLPCPNPRGWYHSVATIADTPEGLVAVYRLSDSHTALLTHIMVAHSNDGGKTWTGHRSISQRNAWEHHRVWVAPQMSRLKDGRLVIIADLGHRTSHDNWPIYRIVREGRTLTLFVDGELKLKADTAGRYGRIVNFASSGACVTEWRAMRARIENPQDLHAVVDWAWDPAKGFPDPFRRDRIVRLDTSPDSGYSGWAQQRDGGIVILDYTNEHLHKNATWHLGPQPFLRAYLATETTLRR